MSVDGYSQLAGRIIESEKLFFTEQINNFHSKKTCEISIDEEHFKWELALKEAGSQPFGARRLDSQKFFGCLGSNTLTNGARDRNRTGTPLSELRILRSRHGFFINHCNRS